MKIRIQYSAQDDPGSWAIRYWSAGPFSHVDTLLIDGRLRGARADVLKGVPAGFQVRPPGYARFSHVAIVELECTPEQYWAFEKFEMQQIGKPYDGPGIVGFILPNLVRARDWREPDSWFCSEEKQAALEACGRMPCIDFPDNRVTPVANYLMVRAAGGTLVKHQGFA
jgi:hypothetical protein